MQGNFIQPHVSMLLPFWSLPIDEASVQNFTAIHLIGDISLCNENVNFPVVLEEKSGDLQVIMVYRLGIDVLAKLYSNQFRS